ncbi:hypothetical protein [Roseibium sp.]|uniref:hypothetical protein n=1 Tax=Roseibium sp. TaxID=1936156 RepID=UPI0032647B5C
MNDITRPGQKPFQVPVAPEQQVHGTGTTRNSGEGVQFRKADESSIARLLQGKIAREPEMPEFSGQSIIFRSARDNKN